MYKCLLIIASAVLVAAIAAADDEDVNIIYDLSYDDMDLAEPPQTVQGRQKRQIPDAAAPRAWMGNRFLHATCRLLPSTGSTVQGHLYLFQKPWRDYLKIKGSLWGMWEPKERFEVSVYTEAPTSPGDCDTAGDTLMGSEGVPGYLGYVKAKGYGRATGFSRGSRALTLERDLPNSVIGRSVVVTSMSSKKKVACCAIQEQ